MLFRSFLSIIGSITNTPTIVTGKQLPSHEVFPSHEVSQCFPVTKFSSHDVSSHDIVTGKPVSQSRCFPVTMFPSHDTRILLIWSISSNPSSDEIDISSPYLFLMLLFLERYSLYKRDIFSKSKLFGFLNDEDK